MTCNTSSRKDKKEVWDTKTKTSPQSNKVNSSLQELHQTLNPLMNAYLDFKFIVDLERLWIWRTSYSQITLCLGTLIPENSNTI